MPEGLEPSVSIVLAEDDQDLAYALTQALSRWNFRIQHATSGEAALELLHSADLLITDVRMEGSMDGLQLLQEAKRRHGELEVIVITGHAAMDTALQCLRSGAFDLILKPFTEVELVASVNRALERQRLHTSAAIYESSRQLFLLQEPGEIPKALASWAARLLDADEVTVLVPDAGDRLETISSFARLPDGVLPAPVEELARRVGREGAPLVYDAKLAQADVRLRGVEGLSRIRSLMVFPLRSADRTTAVLALHRLRPEVAPFRARDFVRASVLATQALVALESYQLSRRYASMERLAAMGEMAAGVAHEINNPMSFVRSNIKFVEDCLLELLGAVALLNEGKSNEALAAWDAAGGPGLYSEVQFAIEEAIEGADRISALVRDMRQVARKEEGTREKVRLADVLESAMRLAGGELKSCVLSVQLPDSERVDADRGRLTQAFVNVLVNAAQAMEHSLRKNLHVRFRSDSPWLYVDIVDTGEGIPGELHARIFEPFFTTKRPGRGTGLGLSIARQTVHDHGGELTFLTRTGQGTTFTFRLPLAS